MKNRNPIDTNKYPPDLVICNIRKVYILYGVLLGNTLNGCPEMPFCNLLLGNKHFYENNPIGSGGYYFPNDVKLLFTYMYGRHTKTQNEISKCEVISTLKICVCLILSLQLMDIVKLYFCKNILSYLCYLCIT